MKERTHYSILGVVRGESPEGIRAAYLRLVKELHPDLAGEASAAAFREVQRAYDVLSDRERRRDYDLGLDRKRPVRTWDPDPLTGHVPPEPLIPEPSPVTAYDRAVPRHRPTEAFDWSSTGPTHIGSSPGFGHNVVDLELLISPGQAARGALFGLAVPVRQTCPACRGTGIDWPFSCAPCGRRGWLARERSLRLTVPPGTRSGTVVRLEGEEVGLHGVVFRIHIAVDRRMRAPPWR